MSSAITLPTITDRLRSFLQMIAEPTDASRAQPLAVHQLSDALDSSLDLLEAEYDRLCVEADAGADVDKSIESLWQAGCELMAMCQQALTKSGGRTRGSPADAMVLIVRQRMERLAEFMRTLAVVWAELDLTTPDDIFEAVWTIRITPLAYLRAMWTLFWSSIRHPFSNTTIELKTGRVLCTE